MCGIICISGNKSWNENSIDQAIATLKHRGPDAQKVVKLPHCHLGHTRLAIIDLAGGEQPMIDVTNQLTIIFNGEIYNYKEIAVLLKKKGHRFITNSDTEVILNGYKEWGEAVVDHLIGQFAFVIWDKTNFEIFAARDRMGEKPLFYAVSPTGELIIASEIKAIFATNLIKSELSRLGLSFFWALEYLPPGETVFVGIKALPPAHTLSCKVGDVAEIKRYWNVTFTSGNNITLNEAREELYRLTEQAVRRQLVADVEVGAFLSGGLDSSTIVAFAANQISRIKTFSVGFDFINELPQAGAVAKRYSTDHYETMVDSAHSAMLEEMAVIFDEPFADSSAIPTYIISRFARQHVKTVLSGDGGDELFGGYDHYFQVGQAHNRSLVYRQSAKILSRVASYIKRSGFSYQGLNHWTARQNRLKISSQYADMWDHSMVTRSSLNLKAKTDIFGNNPRDIFDRISEKFKPELEIKGLDRMVYFDIHAYLPGDILRKVDTVTMANSLESRAPFLDHQLVEFVIGLPSLMRVNSRKRKLLMYEAFSGLWPDEIKNKKKQGFGVPIRNWVQEEQFNKLLRKVTDPNSFLMSFLKNSINVQGFGRRELWKLVCLGLWMEHRKDSLSVK